MNGTVAIDQGTTSTRSLTLLPDGQLQASSSLAHAQHYPQSGWVEHDPHELLRNIRQLLSAQPGISTLALCNQGESCLAWHRHTGEPLSSIIVWQDDRTRAMIEQLRGNGVEPLIRRVAGLPLDPYFTASKLAWLLQNNTEVARLHRTGQLCLGTTDAWFLQQLTGRSSTDVSTASRTSLMDLDSLQWSPELCECFGVPIEALPPIQPTVSDFGVAIALPHPCPIRVSVVDQQAALYGHGAREPGAAKITFGTGAFVQCLTGTGRPDTGDSGVLPTVAWQLGTRSARYALDGGVFCAASAVNWARSIGLFSEFADINTLASDPVIGGNLVFVPALAGLGCPHWQPEVRGQWLGLGLDTDARQIIQAVLEGVAFRSAEILSAMAPLQPLGPVLSIDGGLSCNPWFVQCLANVTGRKIRVSANVECTALGALMLARQADAGDLPELRLEADNGLIEPAADWACHTMRFGQARELASAWAATESQAPPGSA